MRELGAIWALGTLLKGTALLLLVFLVAVALRRASAALRHLVWSGGIIALLLLPFVSLTIPWRLPVPTAQLVTIRPAVPGPGLTGQPAATGRLAGPATSNAVPGDVVVPRGPAAPGWRFTPASLVRLLLWVWLAGGLLVFGRLGLGAFVVRRIVRRAEALDSPDWTRPLLEGADRMALDRVPRLLVSDQLPMPFACGVVSPAIVLPAGAREWTDRRRRAVLCHELAHIRRLDLAVNALGQIACALYWFHPLVWMAARKLRMESERACDDLVLGVGTRPSEYADHLLQIVCRAARGRTPAVALPMAERREFEGRMLAILERDARREPPSPRHAVTLAVFALLLLLPLAALAPARQPPVIQSAAGLEPRPPRSTPTEVPVSSERVAAKPVPSPEPEVPQRTANTPAASYQVETDTEKQEQKRKGEWEPQSGQSEQSSTDPKVLAALMGALEDSVASVREDAVYALGRLEARTAVAAINARLIRDPNAKVREMAGWALGQIQSRDAIAPLGKAAQSDDSEDVKAMAIWALGQIGDEASVPALAIALRDASPEVRGRAAWALGTIQPGSAPPALIAALQDASAPVRVRAAWALGQISDGAAVPGLTALLKDPSSEVRKAAFWALGQMPGDAAQPALIAALKDPDPEIRAKAARALAGGGGDPWPWPWPMPIMR